MRLFGTSRRSHATPAPQHQHPPSVWGDKFGRLATRCIQLLAMLALGAVGIFLIVQLRLILVPVIIALILASALNPIMERLRRWKLPAALAALIMLVSILGIFGLIGWLVSWAVINQWDDLVESAEGGLDQLRELGGNLPITADDDQIQEWQQRAVEFLTSGDVGAGALQGVTTAAHVVTGLVLVIVVLFFFLKDGPTIWEFFLRPFHGEGYERAKRIGRNAVMTMGGYARGTAIIAAADAVGIGIGLAILGVPLALPLTVIVFLTAFIPLLGAVAASALAALVALVAKGPITALIVILLAIAVNQLRVTCCNLW